MKYIISLITGVVTIAGNLYGGYWVWTNSVIILIGFVALDWIIKPVKLNNSAKNDLAPNLVLLTHVLLHTVAIFTLLVGVKTHFLTGGSLLGAIISTGLNSGISGIISAHELIHRKQRTMQYFGIWNLVLVHYTHFYIEHIQNHHKNVGTTSDPATARRSESLYAFILRTIPAQFFSALRIATQGKSWIRNFVVLFVIVQFLVDLCLFSLYGRTVFFAFLSQSLVAIFLLEYVNYVEHYGLVREPGKKLEVWHSWQSNALTSRITLLELSRHSDHHLKSSKPYHTLVSHDKSPEMPGGYFGMFYICLIPSLWFKMVDPLITSANLKAASA